MQCTVEILMNNTCINGNIVSFNKKSMIIKCKSDKDMFLNAFANIHIFNPLKGEIILRGMINSIVRNMIKIVNVMCIEIKCKCQSQNVHFLESQNVQLLELVVAIFLAFY